MTGNLILWAIVLILSIIAEAVTLQLVTIWFVVGAIAAIFAASMGMPMMIQAALFTIVSALLLIATRPVIRKLKVKDVLPSNPDIGKIGIVTESIDNEEHTGRIKIGDVNWKARSFDGNTFSVGTKVCIENISGTTAYVSMAENAYLKEG